jgi:hypothetical protein
MPRSFGVVLVSHCCSPALEGTVIVENGVVLPGRGPGHTGATTIAFAGDPSHLYGYNGGTTDFGFYTMTVGPTGITATSSVPSLLGWFGLEIVSAAGRIYASSGDVVDPSIPRRLGAGTAAGQPVPLPDHDRLLTVSGSTINEYDLDGLWSLGSQQFPGTAATDAVLAGSTVAIATSSELVFVPLFGEDGAGFTPLSPTRVVDSRVATQVGPFSTPWSGGTTRDVQVTGGSSGVPVDAVAVALNVTVTGTTGASYLTAWPKGQARPLASSLNWAPGWTVPNAVTAKVGEGGMVSIYNDLGTADVIIDVVGYFSVGSDALFHPLAPRRIQDSRPDTQAGPYATPWSGSSTRDVTVTGGSAGVPSHADAVLLNVAVTQTTATSYLTVWPAGQAQPLASSHNWVSGWTIANAVTAKAGSSGRIGVFNNVGNVDVIADVSGWYG